MATAVVPDARGHDAAGPGDTSHLAEPRDRIGHEVDDELGQRGVELVVHERELLRDGSSNRDVGLAGLRGGDEGLRRVDRSNGGRPQPSDQLRGQRAWPAADIEHPLPCDDAGEVGEHRGEPDRVPTHEPVIGVSSDREAHGRTAGSSSWSISTSSLDERRYGLAAGTPPLDLVVRPRRARGPCR